MSSRVEQLGDEPMSWRDDKGNGRNSGSVKVHRDMRVCIWCARNNKEGCETECQPEGKYRLLDPVAPDHWEMPPSPPAFREMVDMPAAERLAFLWLVIYYLDRETKRE